MLARMQRPEGVVANEIRQVVASIEPDLAVYGTGSLRQMLGLVYLPMRAAAIALGGFGVLALMPALTGIYGIASYTVARRSKQISIRMAIGALPRQMLTFLFARLGTLVAAGALLGWALGIAGAGLLSAVVYEASPCAIPW